MSVITDYLSEAERFIYGPNVTFLDPQVQQLFNDINAIDTHSDIVGKYLKPVYEPFIEHYIQNTVGSSHGYSLKHLQTFEIDRLDDQINYRSDLPDKRLLWHGTRKENIYKILRDGFDLQLAKDCGMFGAGIYFSDCVSKAANYSGFCGSICGHYSSTGYLLLCEVALGKITPFTKAAYKAKEFLGDSSHASWGKGYWQSKKAWYWNDEVMICPDKLEPSVRHSLDYNEFIVYSTAQISLKYLVKVHRTSNSSCSTFDFGKLHFSIPPKSKYAFGVMRIKEYKAMDLAPADPKKRPPKRSADPIQLPKKRGRKAKQTNSQQPALLNGQAVQQFFNNLSNTTNNNIPNAANVPSTSNTTNLFASNISQSVPQFSSLLPSTNFTYTPATNLPMPNSQQLWPLPLVQQWNTLNGTYFMAQNPTNQMPLNVQNNNLAPFYSAPLNTQPLNFNSQTTITGQVNNLLNYPTNLSINPTSFNFPQPNLITSTLSTLPVQPSLIQNPIKQTNVGTSQNPIVLEDEPVNNPPQPQISLWTPQNIPAPSTSTTSTMPLQTNLNSLPQTQQPLNTGTVQNPIVLEDEEDSSQQQSAPLTTNNQLNAVNDLLDDNDFIITKIIPSTNPAFVNQVIQTNTQPTVNHTFSFGKVIPETNDDEINVDQPTNDLVDDQDDFLMITKIVPSSNPKIGSQNNPIQIDDDLPFDDAQPQQDISTNLTTSYAPQLPSNVFQSAKVL